MTNQSNRPIGTVLGPFYRRSKHTTLGQVYFMVRTKAKWEAIDGHNLEETLGRATEAAKEALLGTATAKAPLITPQTVTVKESDPDKGLTKGRKYKVKGDWISGLYILNDYCRRQWLKDEDGNVSPFCEHINQKALLEEAL